MSDGEQVVMHESELLGGLGFHYASGILNETVN